MNGVCELVIAPVRFLLFRTVALEAVILQKGCNCGIKMNIGMYARQHTENTEYVQRQFSAHSANRPKGLRFQWNERRFHPLHPIDLGLKDISLIKEPACSWLRA